MSAEPSVNCFVAKGFFIGIEPKVAYQKQGDTEILNYAIGPKFGAVFGNAESKILPFITVSQPYLKFITKTNVYNRGYELVKYPQGLNIDEELGMIIKLKKIVGIKLSAQYGYYSLKSELNYPSGVPGIRLVTKVIYLKGDIISLGVGITSLLFDTGEQ